jgi:photosystem II stability/assembly factor-like uncharacterized protein
VQFGSSNDTAKLLAYQEDGTGTAMGSQGSFTLRTGSPMILGTATPSASEAFIVGYSPTPAFSMFVKHSSDGGATWTSQTACGATTTLQDIDSVSTTSLVIVGAGRVCRTTNGGTNWVAPTTAPSAAIAFRGVDMLASGEGWAAGTSGWLSHTTDSGDTWSSQRLAAPYDTLTLADIAVVDAMHVYSIGVKPHAGGGNDFYSVSSADGGVTWSINQIGGTTAAPNAGIAAVNATTLLAGKPDGTWKSTDSGATWTLIDAVATQRIIVLNATTWLSTWSGSGTIRRTVNGGGAWGWVYLGGGQAWTLDQFGGTRAIAVGFNHTYAVSTDTGASFTSLPSPYANLNATKAWTSASFVAVGDSGRVMRTSDGGTSITNPASGTTSKLTDVDGTPTGVAVAVGASGTIIRSTDFGATWSTVPSGTAQQLEAVRWLGNGRFLAVGRSGTVLVSDDVGLSWNAKASPIAGDILDVTSAPHGIVWLGGAAGAIARSLDAGMTWTTPASGTALAIVAIDAFDDLHAAFVVNDGIGTGTGYVTSNGGTSWTSSYTGVATASLYDVTWASEQTLYVGGLNTQFARSDDAGATWRAVPPSVPSHIFDIETLGPDTVMLAGPSEAIATSTPVQAIADYAFGSTDFSGAASTFGACLESTVGTASVSWGLAGAGNCTAANLALWRGIPVDRAAPTALLATTATGTTGSADLRFGMKAGSGQQAAAYSAPVTFEVLAPSS